MKTIKYTVIALATLLTMAGCASDGEDIGDPIDIEPEYTLPQGDAPDSANARIKEMYDKYGSFVLYNFTQKDAIWSPYTGSAASLERKDVVTLGDPQNVGAMLDYIDDIWLKYFDDDFKKKGGIPYRVFLADSLYVQRTTSTSVQKLPYYYKIVGNSVIIAGMNSLSGMSASTKRSRRVELFSAMWEYYRQYGIIDIPEEFYEGTDYVTEPTYTERVVNAWYSTYSYDISELRNRGFMPNYSAWAITASREIAYRTSATRTTWSDEETNKANDYKYYLSWIFQASDAKLQSYLAYPAIKRKWDILLNYYKDKYNIDLRAITKE